MKYKKIVEGRFLSRPNRFIAEVEVEGRRERVHVKNTGRCRELLLSGSRVLLFDSENPQRKTRYDLVAVYKERENGGAVLINMDSQAPNEAAAEWLPVSGLFSESAKLRREVTFGESRFDFYVEDRERRAFIEVKGVTLEVDGVAMFPDAPTERGIKHICELAESINRGYEAYLLFVVQMKGIKEFRPNDAMHKAFGDALRSAAEQGVKIIAMDCAITADSMAIDKEVKINF